MRLTGEHRLVLLIAGSLLTWTTPNGECRMTELGVSLATALFVATLASPQYEAFAADNPIAAGDFKYETDKFASECTYSIESMDQNFYQITLKFSVKQKKPARMLAGCFFVEDDTEKDRLMIPPETVIEVDSGFTGKPNSTFDLVTSNKTSKIVVEKSKLTASDVRQALALVFLEDAGPESIDQAFQAADRKNAFYLNELALDRVETRENFVLKRTQ